MKLDLHISGSYNCALYSVIYFRASEVQIAWKCGSLTSGEIRPFFSMTRKGQFTVISMSQDSLNGLIHIL